MLVLSLTACDTGPDSSSAQSSSAAASASSVSTFSMTPDMSNFLKPGTTDTCFNGGPRPCGLLIRTQPRLSSDVINAPNKQSATSWPLEAYSGSAGSKAGDVVQVACHFENNTDDDGQVSSYEGGIKSRTWFKALVPESQVKNPAIQSEIEAHSQQIEVVRLGSGELAVEGWVAAPWMGLAESPSIIPAC
jgi:hypothetical protein